MASLPTSELLYNEDLAPAKARSWGVRSIASMWMSDVHSIGGYTFAAGLFFLGLAGWQVLLALVLGITIVYFGMNLIGLAGQRTGVPYPVLARLSFGIYGANIPALIRAVIGIVWYGIQTYLASVALEILGLRIFPGLSSLAHGGFLGLPPLGWACFMTLWLAQLIVLRNGMETVRKIADFAGPVIWVVMLVMAVAIVIAAGGKFSLHVSPVHLSSGRAVEAFLGAAGLTVAYFSTLLLNFCDFARFSPDKRAVKRGNFWGLPVNFTAFAIVSVVVTAGSIAVYGKAITDPVELVGRVHNTAVLVVGVIMFSIATLGINIVANFVSPCYDLANVAPRYIDFKRGGVITAVMSLLVMPWKIYANPAAINYFLGGLAAFLGPLFGIMIVDYYVVRRSQVKIDHLYTDSPAGEYHYRRGVNPRAIAAFVPAAAVSAIVALVPELHRLAPFSWFIGAALGATFYLADLARRRASQGVEPSTAAGPAAAGPIIEQPMVAD